MEAKTKYSYLYLSTCKEGNLIPSFQTFIDTCRIFTTVVLKEPWLGCQWLEHQNVECRVSGSIPRACILVVGSPASLGVHAGGIQLMPLSHTNVSFSLFPLLPPFHSLKKSMEKVSLGKD